jgi:hypothetical protein
MYSLSLVAVGAVAQALVLDTLVVVVVVVEWLRKHLQSHQVPLIQ